MDFHSMSEEEQFQIASRECPVPLPPPPDYEMWRMFFLALYAQVVASEEQEKLRYKDTVWDFSVIHSNDPRDHEIANQFVRLLETSLGISGKSLGNVALGENTLEAASQMVEGSSKVFILVSKRLNDPGVPKYAFQSALMQQLQRREWLCKIIPMYLPGENVNTPLFLCGIQGFKLGQDIRTVELVSQAITLESQMQVRATRSRNQVIFRSMLRRQRQRSFQEIQEVIARLREENGDSYDPTQQLQQVTDQISSMMLETGGMGGGSQVIRISGCQKISVGPSFHFHGSQTDTLSNENRSSSTSSSSSADRDSSVFFNP